MCKAREWVEKNPQVAKDFLYTIIYFQGITAMRRGENENCIMCRGETSCILPISKSAVHTNPEGSRLAMRHFKEYLDRFPDDGDARWLLNVAAMTLGEHPRGVDPKWVIDIDRYAHNNDGIGRFRDIGEAIGLNRLNQAGGAIMEDFDNDGRLDIVVTSFDPTQIMGVYFNEGNGKFSDLTADAGVANQLGGLNCVQTDYNNDGFKDVLIVRGAWLSPALAMRPTLLRNNGDRTFTDVTIDAGLSAPINSISAAWADFDNDGWLDVFVCCEQQANRLYRNRGDGTFEEVAKRAGIAGGEGFACKGANWIDFDNDGWQDLFLNHLSNV
ncbi:MAG: FG-GAP repeat domain-containing protein, partial [Pirellula sp.]